MKQNANAYEQCEQEHAQFQSAEIAAAAAAAARASLDAGGAINMDGLGATGGAEIGDSQGAAGAGAAQGTGGAESGDKSAAGAGDAGVADSNDTLLLKAQVDQLCAQIAAEREKHLRVAAEFENIKKRIERQHESDLEYANSKILKDLLPVLDALDQAANFEADDEFSAGLKDGVQNIIRLFAKTLADYGVEKIAPQLGEAVDPQVHEVLMNQPNEALEPGTISMVMQAGYRYKDRILRAAKVAANN